MLGDLMEHGHNTVEKIVRAWATPPAAERYIKRVEEWSQTKRDKALTANDGESYIAIVMAMSLIESGSPCNMCAVREGLNIYPTNRHLHPTVTKIILFLFAYKVNCYIYLYRTRFFY